MNAATAAHDSPNRSHDALNVALWIAQLVLFMVFAMTGIAKATMPIARLAPIMAWVTGVSPALVRFIGVAELSGALGVLLPTATRVRPGLASLAALGLAIVMTLATAVNVATGELAHAPVSLVLGALAAFVAWGRSPVVEG